MERRKRWIGWLVAILLVSAGLNLYLWTRQGGGDGTGATAQAAEETYVCPMHPQVRQDHPGDCPICAMKLVKQEAGGEMDATLDSLASSVHLSPSQEVLANVRTELPRVENFVAARAVPGRIVAREDAQWKASARVMGRVEKLHVATPGQSVRKGQPLYSLFSPDLASAQREYVLAEQNADAQTRTILMNAARNRLISFGLEPDQIQQLVDLGQIKETLTFHASESGVLMETMATEGEWVMPGMVVLDFVDLGDVWAEGTIYEQDMGSVKLGDAVTVTAPAAGLEATGKVSYIAPMVDMMTRTLVFRATLANTDLRWKPEMFVQMTWSGQREQQALSVPEDAVLATGRSTRVWVKVDEGRYRPREVTAGPRQNGRVAIMTGLQPTDEVVVSGGYLIDSDAQLKDISLVGMGHVEHGDTAAGNPAPSGDHSQHEVAPATAKASSTKETPPAAGELWACPMHPKVTSANPKDRCPDCGMYLTQKVK